MYRITNGFVYCTSESLKHKEVSLGGEEEGKGSEAETHMTAVCTTSSLASAATVALIFKSQRFEYLITRVTSLHVDISYSQEQSLTCNGMSRWMLV
jgi:hypothetical protein